jgi:hypothetical protein
MNDAEQVLKIIAEMPISKSHEYDERGSIKHGSSSYGPGYSAWRMKQLAEQYFAGLKP